MSDGELGIRDHKRNDMFRRWGIITAETLRRFGRLPVGTPGQGTLLLMAEPDGDGGLNAGLWVGLQFADDPRQVTGDLFFHWNKPADEPGGIEWQDAHGQAVEVTAADLPDAAVQVARLFVESLLTRRGYQHFRVTEIGWSR